MASVFVTGGTGFLGKNLIRALLDAGHDVKALVRRTSVTEDLAAMPRVTLVTGDAGEPESCREALKGCDTLYHVAAVVKEWVKDWSIFDRVNVEAPPRLFLLARDQGVKRIVYTSSFFAIGPSDRGSGGVVDEATVHEVDHYHNAYERTKAQAMPRIAEAVMQGAPVVTVCPGMIYGPGELTEGNFVVQLLRDVIDGKLPGLPGDGSKMWSYVHVQDVVRGHLQAMEKGRVGETYILGGDNVSLAHFFRCFESLTDIKTPRLKIPFPVLKTVAALDQSLALFGRTPKLTLGKVKINEHHWAYHSTKAERELGYTFRPLTEGLAETVAWMRERGLLARSA